MAATFSLILVLSTIGLESAAFRGHFISEHSTRNSDYFSVVAKLTVIPPLICGLAIALSALAYGGTIFGVPAGALGVSAMGATLTASATTLPTARFRANSQPIPYAALLIVPAIIGSGTKLLLCTPANLGTLGWGIGDLASGFAAWLIAGSFLIPDLLAGRWSRTTATALLGLSLPLVPHVASSWALALVDRFLVASMTNPTELGIYSYLTQLSTIGLILTTELNRFLSPRYGQIASDPERENCDLRRSVVASANLQRRVSILLLMGSLALVTLFVARVVGDPYTDSIELLPLSALGFLAYSFYYPCMNVASIGLGRTKGVPLITASAALVKIAIGAATIPLIGATGAALGGIAGYSVLWLGLAHYTRDYRLAWSSESKLLAVFALFSFTALSILMWWH